MQERETTIITLENGKTATVKAYLTGKENNVLKAALFEGVTVGAEKDMSRVPLSNTFKREEKLIELSVIEFDGSKDAIADRVGELPSSEYDAFIKQLDATLKINFQKAM